MFDSTEAEIEVETIQIFKDMRQKLRTVDGVVLLLYIDVFESETPYVMIFIIKTPQNHSIRMDIQKDQLARELRLWLEGKMVRNPSIAASPRIESKFLIELKFNFNVDSLDYYPEDWNQFLKLFISLKFFTLT